MSEVTPLARARDRMRFEADRHGQAVLKVMQNNIPAAKLVRAAQWAAQMERLLLETILARAFVVY